MANPKYNLNDIVKIKISGEKVKIICYNGKTTGRQHEYLIIRIDDPNEEPFTVFEFQIESLSEGKMTFKCFCGAFRTFGLNCSDLHHAFFCPARRGK